MQGKSRREGCLMSSTEGKLNISDICSMCRVMPILTISDVDAAVPLAQALFEGGIRVMEITLRTDEALGAIRDIRQNVPDMIVGAGTLISPRNVSDACDAGAQFGVSPGATNPLLDVVNEREMPFLPGVSTPSEMMRLMERNFLAQKFFPAQQNGGIAMLKAVQGPLPQISFCPTGGITREAAPAYLALDNIMCVGGSWVAPKEAIKERNWDKIKELASIASGL